MEETTYLLPQEIAEEAYDIRQRITKGQMSNGVLMQMFAHRLENADSRGAIPLREYGLHDQNAVIMKAGSRSLFSRAGDGTPFIKKDVLDTTFAGNEGGGALARSLCGLS